MATKTIDELDVDLFKEVFKKYKCRKTPPDFSELVDFMNLSSKNKEEYGVKRLSLQEPDNIPRLADLRPTHVWNAYTLDKFPGFVHISNVFRFNGQRYWVYRCLHDYPTKPNVTNLDFIEQQLGKERPENLWDACYPKVKTVESNAEKNDNNASKKVKLSSDKDQTHDTDSNRRPESSRFHFDKLRWVTLGYHYNWNDKTYSEYEKSDFPSDLAYLSKYITAAIGHSPVFRPEAAIVNYYHLDSTLGGHTDHSEFDHDAPIVSISLGQDAVFLLGGVTKAVRPVAVHLRSGDVCIMSGSTRLSYHAVPRVFQSKFFKSSFEPEPESDCLGIRHFGGETMKGSDDFSDVSRQMQNVHDNLEWQPYQAHLLKGRMNISIRQVLKAGQTFPKSMPSPYDS